MLMAAALHLHMDMDSAARGLGPSSSSSTSPPPPWFQADDNHRLPAYDFITASAPSPPTPATVGPAPPNHLRPAARRVSKRRPRPSRKLPTTYITADPASFRRMVHQVTGADDLPLPVPPPAETLCRPAPSRAGAMTLPTLDTSAFLLGGAPRVEAASEAGLPAAAPALLDQAEAGGVGVGPAAGGACNYSNGSACGGGFPTLDSWDPLF
ncbi:unnamed protein product [Urochloa decumbens]|uniref:VQ domain-containing protein n=1 Tax=Urochloa decumbens TaxID=240449 RepID=A0ABC8W7V2_9POAL